MSDPLYRAALVTGATSGIGRATVLKLRATGLDVFALGRDAAKLEALARECGATPLVADVRDVGAVGAALAAHAIDVLVSNAGLLSSRARFDQIDPAEIDAMIDVNLKAPMHLARLVLPGMVARKRGHLVFVGSSGGRAAYPLMGAYGPSKAGLSLFCDNLRCDLLGTGIRVSEIAPGRVHTDLYRKAIADDAARAALYDGYRAIQPENVADLIATVLALPDFVDVSRLEVFPTDQASGGGHIVKFDPPR